jgi:hypothetical protein
MFGTLANERDPPFGFTLEVCFEQLLPFFFWVRAQSRSSMKSVRTSVTDGTGTDPFTRLAAPGPQAFETASAQV